MLRARLIMLLLVSSAGCGSDGTPPVTGDGPATRDGATVDGAAPGQLGGPCFPNQTCFAGLRCEQSVCVAAADGGAEQPQADTHPTGDGPLSTDAAPRRDGAPATDSSLPVDSSVPADSAPRADSALPTDSAVPVDAAIPVDVVPRPDQACVPSCTNKSCGADNGCGQPCQSGTCLGPQEVCVAGECRCQPSCGGAVCGGPDGCGGSCSYGSCAQPNTICNGGACVCHFASCGDLCCAAGEYCLNGSCTPGATPGWKIVTSPTQKDLGGVWGSAWNDVWAVGDGGTVLHYNGSQWGPHNSSTTADLRAVSGSARSNVWAIGYQKIVHYDGSAWSTSTYLNSSDTFADVYVADGVAFVAGTNGGSYGSGRAPMVATWDGAWTRWVQPGSDGYLVGIGGSSATDVWAQGWASLVHYDGTWNPQTASGGTFWHGIFGVAADDLWVAGWNNGNCVLLHYEGSDWTPVTCPTSQGLYRNHGTSATDIWAVGSNGTIIHYDGYGWSLSGVGVTTQTLHGVWAASPTEAWAVGSGGTILHYTP